MKKVMSMRRLAAAMVVGCAAVMVSPAAGQPSKSKVEEAPAPPMPGKMDSNGVIVNYLLVVVVIAAVVGVTAIPSRRGHQD